MTKNERDGLGVRHKNSALPDTRINKPVIEGGTKGKFHLLIRLCLGEGLIFGRVFFLKVNLPLIEMICRQVGNCQRFKEDANKAQDSFKKAEDSFKIAKSIQDLVVVNKSIDEAKINLSMMPDSAIKLVLPITKQSTKTSELDRKTSISLALEQNADRVLKEEISKIALNRKPQEEIDPLDEVIKRLNTYKSLHIDAQVLLRSIPDNSFIAINKKEKLEQLAVKIRIWMANLARSRLSILA